MTESELRDRLVQSLLTEKPVDSAAIVETPNADSILSAASKVMTSYQNANKWLDSIKETLLMDIGSVFFSNYIHTLAHTMPVRFDKFGDILHTLNIKIPYPGTEIIEAEPSDIPSAFTQIFNILNSISESLNEFVNIVRANKAIGAAIATEELIVDIEGEYINLFRMKKAYVICGDPIKFDKWVAQYLNNLGNLID